MGDDAAAPGPFEDGRDGPEPPDPFEDWRDGPKPMLERFLGTGGGVFCW